MIVAALRGCRSGTVALLWMALIGCGSPTTPDSEAAERWVSLTAGARHACALSDEGVAYCWGANESGQLGDGTRTDRTIPVRVAGATFSALDAGDDTTCGLGSSGEVHCWGRNDAGQVGDGSGSDALVPTRVAGGSFESLFVGSYIACALASGGSVHCWGADRYGAVLAGATEVCPGPYAAPEWRCAPRPHEIVDAPAVSSLAVGTFHMCGLEPDGGVHCRGLARHGQLGATPPHECASGVPPVGDTVPCARSPVTVQVPPLVSLDAGPSHTCGVTEGGEGYCWGGLVFNYGQIGQGVAEGTDRPTRVDATVRFTRIVPASANRLFTFTCGLDAGGMAYCWGAADAGQLGATATGFCADVACAVTPQPVGGGRSYSRIAVGGGFACGTTRTSDVLCWGLNSSGQLGDGTTRSRMEPAPVMLLPPS